MDTFGIEVFFYAAGVIAVYAVITNRMMRRTQHLRIEAAKLAAEIIKDDRTPKDVAAGMYRIINTLFARKLMWIAAIVFVPVVLLGKDSESKIPQTGYKDLDDKIKTTISLYVQSLLGLSPIASFLILSQAFLLFLFHNSHKRFATIVKEGLSNRIAPGDNHHRHA
ncbi:hypothetical protein [Thalassospira xiamenensis]|uniref:hypothetical protein n=1 Tax=Thalassospira xiamenensis TaxID=220697 RepID=UPI001E39CFF0|nr:hypothetical protein [Thalassospira xiamenensis]MCD1593336.1 hypothetical protein [Thalassospira xiamenensis]